MRGKANTEARSASSGAKTEIPDAESVIVMTRVYDAPRELVWEAITQPEHVARWWGGPGVTNPVCEMDVRPGGQWRHVMCFPDGRELHMSFVFVEVSQPRKLVWQTAETGSGSATDGKTTCAGASSSSARNPAAANGPGNVLFTVTLDALPSNKTAWKLIARFRSAKDREIALTMGFTRPIEASNDRLVEYLKTLSGQTPQ